MNTPDTTTDTSLLVLGLIERLEGKSRLFGKDDTETTIDVTALRLLVLNVDTDEKSDVVIAFPNEALIHVVTNLMPHDMFVGLGGEYEDDEQA